MSEGALSGVRVVDLSRVLAGPLCTQILADQGADVVKIEPPKGDETRSFGPPFMPSGDAAYFSALNRGKRSLSLDLSRAEGRAVVERLLDDADVLVENFLPGTMVRWKLDYATVGPRHHRLVYCSITGFGGDGPFGKLPGYDAVLQAVCGLMSVNGTVETGPTRLGVPVVDHLTGYVAAVAILTALYARERTGAGQHIDTTLFDSAMSLLVPHAANFLYSAREPQLLGSAHPNIAPYDKFRARDREIFLGVANDGQFTRLCEQLGAEVIATDSRFATNASRVEHREALRAALEDVLVDHDAEALCTKLMAAGVPAGSVNPVSTALSQPHATHRELVVEQGDYRGLASPVRLSRAARVPVRQPPRLSEHADQILYECGYGNDEIARLRALRVIG
ncbi:MAG TPA: CoA transferase [Casimicrobiaceae bacterium]|nr:CoA transferase [Casimicrobiaceae bacterium]